MEQFVKTKLWRSQLVPIASLVAGCVLVAVASWHLILFARHSAQGYAMDLWYPVLQTWFLGLATYLISTGLRKMRGENDVAADCAESGDPFQGARSETPRIGWGRILVGTFLIMSCYDLFHPTHNWFELDPSDENVQKFTTIFTYAEILVGALLVASGVRARFIRPYKTTPHF
jgi:hypothetical protein